MLFRSLMHWLAATERFGALAELPRLQRAVTRTCRDLGAAADPAAVLHRDLHDGQLVHAQYPSRIDTNRFVGYNSSQD